MSFDPLIANAGRLQILTSLAVEERQEFVRLRRSTQLTDGNLACHARRLQSAGLINIDKQIRDGRPVTQFILTPDGRTALVAHTRRLMAALSQRRLAPVTEPELSPLPSPRLSVPSENIERSANIDRSESNDDWVD